MMPINRKLLPSKTSYHLEKSLINKKREKMFSFVKIRIKKFRFCKLILKMLFKSSVDFDLSDQDWKSTIN